MEETLKIINQMQRDRVIGKYAIGGGIGATFYVEPKETFDIDIFISFDADPRRLIISLSPIYEYLGKLGYNPKDEHIVIEKWQVQFLPTSDALDTEALSEAVATEVEGEKTWVMTAEHLMAISLRTGRDKDFERIKLFLNHNASMPESAIVGGSSPSYAIGSSSAEFSGQPSKVIIMTQKKVYDEARLNQILGRHKLVEKWEKFKLRIAREHE